MSARDASATPVQLVARMVDPQQLNDALALLGCEVRFRHQRTSTRGWRVIAVSDSGMVEMEGWAGEFAPHVLVPVQPPGAAPGETPAQTLLHKAGLGRLCSCAACVATRGGGR